MRRAGEPSTPMEGDLGYDHKGRPCVGGATITYADGHRATYRDAPWLPWMAYAAPNCPGDRYAVDATPGR